jgi:membrane protease YdiL (CAAX protease family)
MDYVSSTFLELREFSMARTGSVSERCPALGRVLLFFLGCAFLLAVAAPMTRSLPGQWSLLILGAGTSVATFTLTVLFVRWEKLRLADVGAAAGRESLTRLVLGFVVGLFMVALQSSFVRLSGHIEWVRTPGVSLAPIALTLFTYLLLASREELAFHGYPLRRLERFFGTWTAQLIVAFVFAMEHRVGGYSW